MDLNKSVEVPYASSDGLATFFNKVFLLMMFGVFTTFAVTYGTIFFASFEFIEFIANNYYVFLIAEIGVVLFLRVRMFKMTAFGCAACFIIYSVLTGFTFTILCLVAGSAVFTQALLTTTGYFLILTVVGFVGKKDLSDMGNTLRISLIAIIILSIINLIFGSDMINLFITVATLLIFTAFTVYDIRTLKKIYYQVSGGSEAGMSINKIAVFGALALYMDFINLFISILELFSRAKRN